MHYPRKRSGFTMIELLVAVAIIALLILVFMFLMRNQKARGSDARRKADLENIKTSFEDYYNDNDCYPPDDVLDVCGDKSFSPYLREIPCDPMTKKPYAYEPVANCGGYRAYAVLEYTKDPVIEELGCAGSLGCGAVSGSEYNYAIAIGVPLNAPGNLEGASPVPSPSPGFVYACDSGGVCNRYIETNPDLVKCPITFEDSLCESSCASLANRCTGF